MDNKEIISEIMSIEFRWNKFKRLRNRLKYDFDVGNVNYLTVKDREHLIDKLLKLTNKLNERQTNG